MLGWTSASVSLGAVPPMTVGIRHAPSNQAMYPPVGAMSLGHLEALQVALSLNQAQLRYGTHLRLEFKGDSWRHEGWFKQLFL